MTALAGTGTAKRSLTVAGHRTSVSLEDAFWTALRDIAAGRGLPVAALVAELDRTRGDANLSSAIRVFVLAAFRGPGGGNRASAEEGLSGSTGISLSGDPSEAMSPVR